MMLKYILDVDPEEWFISINICLVRWHLSKLVPAKAPWPVGMTEEIKTELALCVSV